MLVTANLFSELLSNKILIAAIIAWVISQVLKTLIHLVMHREFSTERLLGDGGFPSSHSATVTALATMIGLTEGFGSPIFALSAMFAVVVMHDARGVRLETGKQAKAINELSDMIDTLMGEDQPTEDKLKELVGHTPLQVFSGLVLGIIVAVAVYNFR